MTELIYEKLPAFDSNDHQVEFITYYFNFMLSLFKCIAKRKSIEKTELFNSTDHTHATFFSH